MCVCVCFLLHHEHDFGRHLYRNTPLTQVCLLCVSVVLVLRSILLYEMLCGMPPFRAKSRNQLQQQILQGKVKYPKFLSSDALSLLKGLLTRDATKRLGECCHCCYCCISSELCDARLCVMAVQL